MANLVQEPTVKSQNATGMSRSETVKRTKAAYVVFGGYAILGLIFSYFYRHLLFTDGISYFLVAEQYVEGNWSQAVNGYWGPLLSWLLVPFLHLGIDPQIAFRLLNWLAGGIALFASWRISKHFDPPDSVRVLFLAVTGIMFIAWSIDVITPDLLFTCLLLLLFDRLMDDNLAKSSKNGIVCGMIGGLAYLTKPFGFGFFLIAFPLALTWQLLIQQRRAPTRQILVTVCLGLGTFLFITVPWVAVISVKYEELTIATSSSFNMAIRSPHLHTHPHLLVGLLPPPFYGALSSWYDPSLEPFTPWNPLRSTSDLMFGVRKFVRNFLSTVGFFGWISFVLAGLIVMAMARPDRLQISRSPVGMSMVLITVYVGLYCLVLVEGRYLWPVMVLSWLAAMKLVVHFRGAFGQQSILVSLLLGLVCILVLVNPVGLRSSTVQPRGATTLASMSSELDKQVALMHLNVLPDSPGRVASNGEWEYSMYISYHVNAEYYGMVKPSGSDTENRQALSGHQVEWFLLWGKDTTTPAYLTGYTETAEALDGQLRVFRRD